MPSKPWLLTPGQIERLKKKDMLEEAIIANGRTVISDEIKIAKEGDCSWCTMPLENEQHVREVTLKKGVDGEKKKYIFCRPCCAALVERPSSNNPMGEFWHRRDWYTSYLPDHEPGNVKLLR